MVGAFVIEAAVLVQRTACVLLLLVALQHGDHSMPMEIDSDRRFLAADLVGVKEPLPENEDTGEMASQDPEENGIGERDVDMDGDAGEDDSDDDMDDDAGEDDSDDDMEGSDDSYSETDSDEGSSDEDDEDEDDEDDEEDMGCPMG